MAFNMVLRNCFAKMMKPSVPIDKHIRLLCNGIPALNKKEIEITFVKHDGTRLKAKGKIGESLLDVVINNGLTLEGYGACEGTLTCSTCHVVFKQEDYDQLPDTPVGEECDMLELARESTSTSRLGCQVFLSESMDGLVINVPESPNDARIQ